MRVALSGVFMRLLLVAFPRLGRLVPPAQWLVTATFGAMLVALECVGRLAQSDVHDLLGALVLLSGVFLVLARHKRYPLRWVEWLRERFERALRFEYQHGYDLRGDPPYPARLPPGYWALVGAIIGLGAAAALASNLTTGGLRVFALGGSYVVYLAGLVGLWLGLAVATLAGLGLPHLVFSLFFRRPPGRGPWLAQIVVLGSYVSFVWSLSQVLPPAAPLAIAAGGVAAIAARLARRNPHDAAILWRADDTRPIYAVPMRLCVAAILALAVVATLSLSIAACGPWLFRFPPHSIYSEPASIALAEAQSAGLVLTPAFAVFVAWLMPGAALALAISLSVARRLDPAARGVPTASVAGERPGAELIAAARAVAGWGWRVRKPGHAPADVALEVVAPDQSEAYAFDARWPLRVAVADLDDPEVKDRLARRDELTLRREALRGVRTLLKRGIAERAAKGGSFQFAPHWWFFDRMTREESRRGGAKHRPVGPPFQRLFTPRVRQHLHDVFRATQIDIVLVEDGVSARRFQRVMKSIFELYDKTRGTRRAEEQHFSGVPKVRVMFHDYAPETPFRATRYAEPHLDDLDRARVLHVFRDSGDQEVEIDEPFDFSWEPSPSLGVG